MPRLTLRDPVALLGLLLAGGLWLLGTATLPLTQRTAGLYHIEPIGEIRGEQTVGQTFIAAYDGLYRIDVYLADYGHPNTGPVYFKLKASPASGVLAEVVVPAEAIRGDVMYRFEFPPQSLSANRWYYFELAAPSAQEGDAVTAYIQPIGLYPNGEAFVAGRPVPGDIVFDQYFRVDGWQRARILVSQLAAGKPAPWGWAGFYPCLGAVYLAVVAALIHGLATRRQA